MKRKSVGRSHAHSITRGICSIGAAFVPPPCNNEPFLVTPKATAARDC